MGGISRYPVLKDDGLNKFKPYFGNVPEIVSNILEEEALEVFKGTALEGYFGSNKK
jgi:hypothetical protein